LSVRRLYIGIRGAAERAKALREAMRSVARRDDAQQNAGLYFENLEEVRRVLTEKRLELLLAIRRDRPASVNELAGMVKRDYKNVSTDVSVLQRLGLVTLETQGHAQVPKVAYDEIQVTVDLGTRVGRRRSTSRRAGS
jgi:predicted transcriptional regulator